MTKKEYAQYQADVKQFFEREGITNLSLQCHAETNYEPYFSHQPCDCCGGLAGDRYDCRGYNPETKQAYDYSVCPDCVYYGEYGQLDDGQMMEIEASES